MNELNGSGNERRRREEWKRNEGEEEEEEEEGRGGEGKEKERRKRRRERETSLSTKGRKKKEKKRKKGNNRRRGNTHTYIQNMTIKKSGCAFAAKRGDKEDMRCPVFCDRKRLNQRQTEPATKAKEAKNAMNIITVTPFATVQPYPSYKHVVNSH